MVLTRQKTHQTLLHRKAYEDIAVRLSEYNKRTAKPQYEYNKAN
jgi:hypothetical protein